jgi:GNAT superfamily N-acetyltransferase
MFSLELSDAVTDLERIIELQQRNHPTAVAPDLWETQGFVTMEYTVQQLQIMSGKYRHVVAKHNNAVVGYALIMLRDHSASFPFLRDMFQDIEAGAYSGKLLRESRYFVMGQVCIEKDFRGKGIFKKLYHGLREQMGTDFDFVITEVSTRNGKSMRAHEKLGFENIKPEGTGSSEWNVIAWDWR